MNARADQVRTRQESGSPPSSWTSAPASSNRAEPPGPDTASHQSLSYDRCHHGQYRVKGEALNGDVVALTVGLSTAMATVIVGLLNRRGVNNDIRANLSRDIEMARSLQDGSVTRRRYERLIELEVRKLLVYERTQPLRIGTFVFFVIGQTCLITVLVRQIIASPEGLDHHLRSLALAAFVAFSFFGFLAVRTARNEKAKSWGVGDRGELTGSKFTRVKTIMRVARWPAAVAAAWSVLAADGNQASRMTESGDAARNSGVG